MPKRLAVSILCLFLLPVLACKASQFEKIAKGIEGVAITVQGLQNVLIEGNLRGSISTEDARKIMQACVKISEANSQASGLVRQLHKLSQDEKVTLFQLLHPVLEVIDQAVALDLSGIKNPEFKAKIKLAIGTMQLALRTIEAALIQETDNGV